MYSFPFFSFFRLANLCASLSMLLISCSSYGYLFCLDQWRKNDQNVYCFSDAHILTSYSQMQRDEIAQFAKEHDARIIVEDMFDYDGTDDRIQHYLSRWHDAANGKEFLLGSVNDWAHQGIAREKIDNVEFRQAVSAAIDGGVPLSTNNVMQPAYDEYHKGWKYRDSNVFNCYYKSRLQEYRETILKPCRSLFFYMYWRKNKPIAQVLSNAHYYASLDSVLALFNDANLSTSDKKLEYIILMHGIPLVNLKAARALAQACEQDIIICAGSGHIREVNKMLDEVGYQHVRSESGTVCLEYPNVPNALNVHQALLSHHSMDHITVKKIKQSESNETSNISHTTNKQETTNRGVSQLFFLIIVLFAVLVFFFKL